MTWRIGGLAGLIVVGLLLAQPGLSLSPGSAHASPVLKAGLPSPAVAHPTSTPAVKAPLHPSTANLTFPRTVLIETFTGVWCIHCPSESQALYNIDEHTSHSVLAISELHSCAFAPGSGPCLENYVPPDGTTTTRGSYYNICGFPDVFFDGQHDACGSTNSMAGMENQYNDEIANASMYPGNVSISDSAVIVSNNVSATTEITSGVTGTYNVITYLMEWIGKLNQSNGYGPHDVAWVVRETLHNHPVSLTAGTTTQVTSRGPILAGWDQLNFSIVSFVQQNSTKIVQNANFAPVTTISTSVGATSSNLSSNAKTTITAHVTNTSTFAPVAGATVTFSSNAGGWFTPDAVVTDANGNVTTSFQAPNVTAVTNVLVTASVSDTGYTADSATTSVVVNPLYAPGVARNLTVIPASGQIVLSWGAPTSGSGGVSYDLYRASAATGPFLPLVITQATNYTEASPTAGETEWFQIIATNVAGAGPTSSTIVATSVAVSATGLPAYTGWWISDGTYNFTSPSGDGMNLFLPTGALSYYFGAKTYAYLADPTGSGALLLTSKPVTIALSFSPRLGNLAGTVDPGSAYVTVNGTAVSVSGGSFSWAAPAGTYWVNATANGYVRNSTQVTLTPGNTSSVNFLMQRAGSNGAAPAGGLDTNTEIEIIAIVAVAALGAVLVVGMAIMRRRRMGGG